MLIASTFALRASAFAVRYGGRVAEWLRPGLPAV